MRAYPLPLEENRQQALAGTRISYRLSRVTASKPGEPDLTGVVIESFPNGDLTLAVTRQDFHLVDGSWSVDLAPATLSPDAESMLAELCEAGCVERAAFERVTRRCAALDGKEVAGIVEVCAAFNYLRNHAADACEKPLEGLSSAAVHAFLAGARPSLTTAVASERLCLRVEAIEDFRIRSMLERVLSPGYEYEAKHLEDIAEAINPWPDAPRVESWERLAQSLTVACKGRVQFDVSVQR